jgi:hypothetical protein
MGSLVVANMGEFSIGHLAKLRQGIEPLSIREDRPEKAVRSFAESGLITE